MASFGASIRRTLGLTAARRGRDSFSASEQHDGERFRNVKPRPVEGLGKTLGIMWNMLLNKASGSTPCRQAPCPSMR